MGESGAELGKKVYLDANIIIYSVEGFADLADQIRALLAALDGMEIVAVTSELTLAEVLVKPLKDQNQTAEQAYKTFLTPTPVLQLIPVSRDVLEEAARLRAATAFGTRPTQFIWRPPTWKAATLSSPTTICSSPSARRTSRSFQ